MAALITPEIHELACAANRAVNALTDAVESQAPSGTEWELRRELLDAVDALTTAIADEEA